MEVDLERHKDLLPGSPFQRWRSATLERWEGSTHFTYELNSNILGIKRTFPVKLNSFWKTLAKETANEYAPDDVAQTVKELGSCCIMERYCRLLADRNGIKHQFLKQLWNFLVQISAGPQGLNEDGWAALIFVSKTIEMLVAEGREDGSKINIDEVISVLDHFVDGRLLLKNERFFRESELGRRFPALPVFSARLNMDIYFKTATANSEMEQEAENKTHSSEQPASASNDQAPLGCSEEDPVHWWTPVVQSLVYVASAGGLIGQWSV